MLTLLVRRLLRRRDATRILSGWPGGISSLNGLAMMYRVIAIVCAGLALAACESGSDWMKSPDWMKAPDWSKGSFRWEPVRDTVQVESEPPGAEAKASTGQSCRTPCALSLPGDKAATVTFNLAGYQADAEKLDLVAMGDGSSQLRPNPLLVELTPLPPPPKPTKKKAPPKKKTAAKQAAKPAAPASAAPRAMSPPPQQSSSPWPTSPQR